MSLIGDVSHSSAVSKNRNPGLKQLLFPNSVQNAPLDVVRLVLYWINDVQLARMREVSRTWNATILGDHRLNLRLVRNSCLFEAKAAAARMDQNEGLRKAQILRKIVKVAAQYNLEKAKAIARTISSSPYGEKALAFLEIAKSDPQHDFTIAKEEVCKSVGRLLDIRKKIAKVEAQYDLRSATAWANTFNDSFSKTCMLIEIAKVDPHHGLFAAKEAALTLRLGLKSQYDKDLLLYKIVKIEAKHDLYSAKITAQNIEDTHTKTLALLEIAQLDPKHDFTDVKSSALTINYSNSRQEVFVKIIKEEAKYDLTEAKKTLAMTGNDDKAILEIVKVEARYSYNDAKSRALTIQDPLFKTEAFLELAKLRPSANIIKFVKDSALYARVFSIYNVNILLEITKLDPYHDFTDIKWAVMALYPIGIYQCYTKFSQALLNIVKEEARYDFVAAKATALTIILNDFKALALLKIAKTAQKQLEGR